MVLSYRHQREQRNRYLRLAPALMFCFVMLAFACSASRHPDSKELIGTWKYSHEALILDADGNFLLSDLQSGETISGKYNVSGNQLELKSENDESNTFSIKLNGANELHLTDKRIGNELVYSRAP